MSESEVQLDWLDMIERDHAVAGLDQAMAGGELVRAVGRCGFSTIAVAAALHRRRPAPRLLVVAHLDDADDAVESLRTLGIEAARFPALERLPGDRSVRMDLLIDRIVLASEIESDPRRPRVLVAPVHALMQPLPSPEVIDQQHRVLRVGDRCDRAELAEFLVDGGYQRVTTIEEPGEFALRGDILDIFPRGSIPTRLDLDDETVEAIWSIELDTMGSQQRLARVDLMADSALDAIEAAEEGLLSRLDGEWELLVDDLVEVTEQGRNYLHRLEDQQGIQTLEEVFAAAQEQLGSVATFVEADFPGESDVTARLPISRNMPFPSGIHEAVADLVDRAREDEVVMCCRTKGDANRFQELIEGCGTDSNPISSIHQVLQDLPHGFRWKSSTGKAYSILSYDEFVNRVHLRRRTQAHLEARPMDAFVDIEPDDYVVHRDHGIASFVGLQVMARGDGPEEEFLTLEFARSARLHVPVVDIELVQKYIGAFAGGAERSVLGGASWSRRKDKASDSVRELAQQMLEIQADRQALTGTAFGADTPWQREFESAFPWDETEDQLTAIESIKQDMQSARPMDRLLCGDVGFGKTEVAIRAAFKAIESGRQVAVLVPTTVLAEQHGRTFSDRLAGYPFRVESLSRFKNAAAQREVIDAVAAGEVDVLVGTHRLLSADVRFQDLGLVVIDEEQRFGVQHKQKLLRLRSTVDVLTMTATPIPRTLHMSMLGLRDISSLTTAPQDRRAVVTELMSWNDERIRDALRRELARQGQAFVVHNRVKDLDELAQAIRLLVPDARVVVGHGQMTPSQLERVMHSFINGEADILVCTTIIESGIDIPTANTMIIDEADLHGLADLHQLRGRVGRFRHRAYCYLVLPRHRVPSELAMRRLQALEGFSMLGAGFRIALRDLEIRGAGNLLGAEQSGHIAAVGYELYCRLLEQAVLQHKRMEEGDGSPLPDPTGTTIDLGLGGIVPEAYVPSPSRRMDVYRRLFRCEHEASLLSVVEDIISAYGAMPTPVQRLIDFARIRVLAMAMGVRSIRRRDPDIVFRVTNPRMLEQHLQEMPGRVHLVGTGGRAGTGGSGISEVYWRPEGGLTDLPGVVSVLCDHLAGGGQAASKPSSGASARR
ncbi:MAG: transcription-repair coupling factor [Phycisphaerales bacterium]|nr:transcription-repair coupling factor [Phycisphaerales bacterium]